MADVVASSFGAQTTGHGGFKNGPHKDTAKIIHIQLTGV